MCKLLTITGRMTRKQAAHALLATRALFEKSQPHGFGFIAADSYSGAIAFGRYLNPEAFFGFGLTLNVPSFLTGPVIEFGRMPLNPNILMIHGRTSTNTVRVENVHPFKSKDNYLAHNGILDWNGERKDEPKAAFDCDSEQLLNWLNDGGSFETAHQFWGGYGAIFLYESKARRLTLAKDDTARLVTAKRSAAGYVFGTDADDVKKVASAAGMKLRTGCLTVPEVILEFNGEGEIEKDRKWNGFSERVMDARFFSSYGIYGCYEPADAVRTTGNKDQFHKPLIGHSLNCTCSNCLTGRLAEATKVELEKSRNKLILDKVASLKPVANVNSRVPDWNPK